MVFDRRRHDGWRYHIEQSGEIFIAHGYHPSHIINSRVADRLEAQHTASQAGGAVPIPYDRGFDWDQCGWLLAEGETPQDAIAALEAKIAGEGVLRKW